MAKFSMKKAIPQAGKYALTSAGAVAASAVIGNQKVFPGKKKWVAAAAWAAGLISSVFNPEEYSNAFITGAGAIGAVHATAGFTKKPDMFGVNPALSGLAENIDWKKLAEEAGTQGVDNQDLIGTDGTDDLDGADDLDGVDFDIE